MIDMFATCGRRPKLWAVRAFVLLILLAVGFQAVHVHAEHEFSTSICLACVSAHTSVPVAAVIVLAILVAITFVIVQSESDPPTYETVLKHTIRPPPSY